MRIAFFTEVFPPKIDGISNRLRHTLEQLRRLGHEALVFAPSGSDAECAGFGVVRVPGPPLPLYPGLRVALPDPRIVTRLARFRPEVVHAVGPACLGVFGIAAARSLGLPLVASYHTDLPRYLAGYRLGWARRGIWPLLRRIHNAADLNLCPSRFTRRELEEHGVRRVALWKGGVDTRRFHPSRRSRAMRERLSAGHPEAPLLLYVGRLAREKRVETLAWVRDAVPGARLAIVGDGPDRSRLEKVFGGDMVTFTGFLRGDELAAAYASADVFVFPSPTETLGFVCLEAQASGCAVVAADAGGIPDVVRHGENGLLFDPDRPEEAATLLRTLLACSGRLRFLAEQGRKSAEGQGWERETAKLVLRYREAVARRRGRSLAGRLGDALRPTRRSLARVSP